MATKKEVKPLSTLSIVWIVFTEINFFIDNR
jgi:hypothetical protein